MTPILHPTARDRLVKLLGLLGSEHHGERANAAQMASRLLAQCGLTWADVIQPPPAPLPPVRPVAPGSAYAAARWAKARAAELPQRDRAFLDGIQGRHALTQRQAAWLADIVARLQAAAAQREAAR